MNAPDARWVDSPAALAALVEELTPEPRYALDTEFHRERTYYPRLALVQLGWGNGQVALIDPFAVDIAPLATILDGPATAVVHAADQDLEVLLQACGTIPTTLFDTQIAAGFLGYSSPSLTALLEARLGQRLPKGGRMSDWTVRPLLADQVEYAVADVAHLLGLHRDLTESLEARGRLAWADQECAELRNRSREPVDPETAWWRLKESRALRGQARAVAQAVAAWRERRAAAEDRPTRMVLPDLAVSAIAHRPPASVDQLRAMRGVESRYLRSDVAREILAAVEQGRSLPPDQLRRPPADPAMREHRPALALAAAWVAEMARELEIDAALLATRADLQAFLAGETSGRVARGWRSEVVGEPLTRLVRGEVAIAVEDGRLVVEPRQRQAGRSTTADSGPTVPL